MRSHTATSLSTVLVLLTCSVELASAQRTVSKSAAFWRMQALSCIDQIDKDDPQDHALYESRDLAVKR